jgi:hypothetical protein
MKITLFVKIILVLFKNYPKNSINRSIKIYIDLKKNLYILKI